MPLNLDFDPRTGLPFDDRALKRIVALGVFKRWIADYRHRRGSKLPTMGKSFGNGWGRMRNMHRASVDLSLARLRVKAHTLSQQEFHALGQDSQFWAQGDESLHNREVFEHRMMLRKHPLVMKQLNRWLCLIEQPAQYNSYVGLMLCIYKALVPPPRRGGFDEADARACAEEDWQADTGDDDVLSQREYLDCIFQLADHWTMGVSAREYAKFLQLVLGLISSGGRLKSLDEICFADINALLLGPMPDERSMNARHEAELERLRKMFAAPAIPIHMTNQALLVSRNHFYRPMGMAMGNESGAHLAAPPPGVSSHLAHLNNPSRPMSQAASSRLSMSNSGLGAHSDDGLRGRLVDGFDSMPDWHGISALKDALATGKRWTLGIDVGSPMNRRGFSAGGGRPDRTSKATVQRQVARAWLKQQEHGLGPIQLPVL